MKTIHPRMLGVLSLLVVAGSGCTDLVGGDVVYGSGQVASELRGTGRFTAVSNATLARVEILQGPYDRVRVQAEQNLLPYLVTQVSNGELRIFVRDGVILRPSQPVIVEIDMGVLRAITSSGSGDIHAPLVDATVLDIVSSGAGEVNLPRLLADSVIINSSGAGRVTVDGDVLRSRIVHSGAGPIDTRDLNAYHVHATLSGSGTATVRARDTLRAILSGSGSLRYYGNPRVEQSVSGAGRVERVGS